MKLSELMAIAPHLPPSTEVSLPNLGLPSTVANEEQACWKLWGGWSGNHDQRIEGAECSNCGYVHPTVYGSLKKLAPNCPGCKAIMGTKET